MQNKKQQKKCIKYKKNKFYLKSLLIIITKQITIVFYILNKKMNHNPIQIIIYILPIIISFPVSFHLYVDDYIVSISNENKPNTREYTAGTVYERTFIRELRDFGPFNANYGDVFHFLLYNQKEVCLYGLGGYFKINGYYIRKFR